MSSFPSCQIFGGEARSLARTRVDRPLVRRSASAVLLAPSLPQATRPQGEVGKSFAAKRFRYAVEIVGTAIMMASFLVMALLG